MADATDHDDSTKSSARDGEIDRYRGSLVWLVRNAFHCSPRTWRREQALGYSESGFCYASLSRTPEWPVQVRRL